MKPTALNFLRGNVFTTIALLLGAAYFCQAAHARPQLAPGTEAPWKVQENGKLLGDNKPADDVVTDTSPSVSPNKLNENYIRFYLWDGSIVSGDLQVEAISLATEFGTLQIPINSIKNFHPGLNSFPELNAKIQSLVEGLGDKNFDVREESQRELTAMGLQIRNEIQKLKDDGSAERKKRLGIIRNEIKQALAELEESGDEFSPERSLIRGDSIETPEFSAVGKIQQQTFTLQSKFGQLSVQLSDIKMAERPIIEQRLEVRKTISVGGESFFQRAPMSTGIRVSRGDKIKVKADGIVQWTNWSKSSGPDGMPNQGKYQGISSGTLCARIGNSGKIVELGSKGEFVAEGNGMLYLAIAMQDSLENNSGYTWTGQYKAKVHLRPIKK